MNQAAHQRFRQSSTHEETNFLPKYADESDIGLCRALELLRQPLCFDKLAGNGFGPQENPASVTHTGNGGWSTAMSGHVMRGGRHFVEFSIASGSSIPPALCLGVIRPPSLTNDIDLGADWEGRVNPMFVTSSNKPAVSEKLRSQRTAKWGDSNIHCCAYHCFSGRCCWTDWNNDDDASDWQGREDFRGSGTVGLLLDLNEGTLSLFKNSRRLGMIKDGLGGEYCWFSSVCRACMISISKITAPN